MNLLGLMTHSMRLHFNLIARLTAGLLLVIMPCAAMAQGADPAGSGPINSALLWLQGTLLGTVATTVAVMAVAAIGFMMLTGRMNWRFGATVIIGVFILFGATTIVAGIQSAAG
jgi:type IV secretory pathway VirB2 component (pilin)